jgi:hypothetical protein
MIELHSKGWAVFGRRGSGKSWFVKSVLETTPDHYIYDPLEEHKGYNRYRPTNRDGKLGIEELNGVIRDVVDPTTGGIRVTKENQHRFPTRRVGEKWNPELFVIDESNRYIFPHPVPIPQPVANLIDFQRHYSLSFGIVARRMTQVPTTLVELADHVFVFNLPGANDYQKLESMYRGLGDEVRNLPPYHFVRLSYGSEITVHAPIRPPAHPNET